MAGRPPHEGDANTRKMVEAMAGAGVPEKDIARALSIDPKTLRKHYRHQLDNGHIIANALVANNLFKIATSQGKAAVAAAIFWLKCRAGWSEHAYRPPEHEPQPLGKKEQADLDAQNPDQTTDMGRLIAQRFADVTKH